MSTTTNTTTIETITRTLADHTEGMTTRELVKATGLAQTTVQAALVTMEAARTARRTPGNTTGNRRSGDLWRPIVPAPDETTETITDHPSPATDVTAPADTPTDQPDPSDSDDSSDTPADPNDPSENGDLSDASDTPSDHSDGAPLVEAPVSAPPAPVTVVAPVSAPPAPIAPRQPDLKVLIMAGVLGNHPAGVSAHEAIAESGLAVNVADTILLAMEVVGVARRLPVADDGTELWVRGDGDLALVDPANAPTHVTCPTCGHTRPIRRATAAARRQTTRPGRPAPEINNDGSERLSKNALRTQVEAFMRDLGTGHDVTPGTVAREVGGRSSGAVANAMSRLTQTGVLIMTCEAPVKYALAPNLPAPTAEVIAFMTRPVIDDDTPADEVTIV